MKVISLKIIAFCLLGSVCTNAAPGEEQKCSTISTQASKTQEQASRIKIYDYSTENGWIGENNKFAPPGQVGEMKFFFVDLPQEEDIQLFLISAYASSKEFNINSGEYFFVATHKESIDLNAFFDVKKEFKDADPCSEKIRWLNACLLIGKSFILELSVKNQCLLKQKPWAIKVISKIINSISGESIQAQENSIENNNQIPQKQKSAILDFVKALKDCKSTQHDLTADEVCNLIDLYCKTVNLEQHGELNSRTLNQLKLVLSNVIKENAAILKALPKEVIDKIKGFFPNQESIEQLTSEKAEIVCNWIFKQIIEHLTLLLDK